MLFGKTLPLSTWALGALAYLQRSEGCAYFYTNLAMPWRLSVFHRQMSVCPLRATCASSLRETQVTPPLWGKKKKKNSGFRITLKKWKQIIRQKQEAVTCPRLEYWPHGASDHTPLWDLLVTYHTLLLKAFPPPKMTLFSFHLPLNLKPQLVTSDFKYSLWYLLNYCLICGRNPWNHMKSTPFSSFAF